MNYLLTEEQRNVLLEIAQELYQDGYDNAEPAVLGCITYADRITAAVTGLEEVNGDHQPPPSTLPTNNRQWDRR
jgi:hypothetical protein